MDANTINEPLNEPLSDYPTKPKLRYSKFLQDASDNNKNIWAVRGYGQITGAGRPIYYYTSEIEADIKYRKLRTKPIVLGQRVERYTYTVAELKEAINLYLKNKEINLYLKNKEIREKSGKVTSKRSLTPIEKELEREMFIERCKELGIKLI